ncbi:unnamed protein product [Cyprideis torosa]|uniref:HECT-type E3 ubiquitin transferase n=1 Tax=Cyprideis torosa TaxID=163714 RepID=A0A7R8WFI9_9CRUS|nr:unnamed protein product [Cyprideis torosa]CAG0891922.1 unnamed protein product [Cyprideis torosa]
MDVGNHASGLPPPPPPPASFSRNHHQWHQLGVRIEEAGLHNVGYGLRDPRTYVEIWIDGKFSKKTDIAKGSTNPKYNEDFSILVTPFSRVEFRVKSRGTFTKDTLIGTCTVDIYGSLKKHGGVISQRVLKPSLIRDGARNVGELRIVVDGMRVEMEGLRPHHYRRNGSTSSHASVTLVAAGDSQGSGGVVSSSTAVSPSSSSNHVPGSKLNSHASPAPNIPPKPKRPPPPVLAGLTSSSSTNHRSSVVLTDSSSCPSPTTNHAHPAVAVISSSIPVIPATKTSIASTNGESSAVSCEKVHRSSSSSHHSAEASSVQVTPTSPSTQPVVPDYKSTTSWTNGAAGATASSSSPPPPHSSSPTLASTSSKSKPEVKKTKSTDNGEAESEGKNSASTPSGSSRRSGERLAATSADSPSSGVEEPLPRGWEIRHDTRGRRYYVDHNTKSTSWERPMPLPSGWEIGIDSRGRTYYVDHNTKTTTWQRPNAESLRTYQQWQGERSRIRSEASQRFLYPDTPQVLPTGEPVDDGLGPLPEGWERRVQAGGRVYFVNHKNKTTQWEDPRTQGLAPPTAPVAYERSLRWALNHFRYLCHSNILSGLLRIVVTRQNLFEQSFHQIMRLEAFQLRRRLYVMFKGEEGLDYGGVAREWFFLLSHEVLNPMYCLFEYANPEHTLLQINPASNINPDHLLYFRFIGRFIAMALYHRNFIYSGFTLPFYKQMLGKKLVLKDLESVDPEFYQSLKWILDNNIDECDLEMYFTADFECLGKVTQHDLKPNGASIRVTQENKEEYVQLMMEWRMTRGKDEQTKAFLDGFNEVVPLEWLKYFDERELQLLLCGMQEIDVEDWKRNTILRHYSENSKQILWFWQFVRELDNEKRARLLQFVTGSCQVPYGGFAMLMGSNSLQRFCIERVGKETWLPRSHTCFNRLDLPPYKSYDQLKEKLLYAIEQTEGFGQE